MQRVNWFKQCTIYETTVSADLFDRLQDSTENETNLIFYLVNVMWPREAFSERIIQDTIIQCLLTVVGQATIIIIEAERSLQEISVKNSQSTL